MEIELVSPTIVVPEDIEIGVRHFLTVPSGKAYNLSLIHISEPTRRS